MSLNFVSGESRKGMDGKPVYPKARDVLASQLGNFTSPAKLEFLAQQHELKTGQVLQRDGESDAAYLKRRKEFLTEHKGEFEKVDVAVNPVTARRELDRMERSYRPRQINWKDEREAAAARDDFRMMNVFRRVLGIDGHDYEKEGVPNDAVLPETMEKYVRFAALPDEATKIAALATVDDPNLARVITAHETNEKVRAAAENRYGQLMMVGRV